MPPLAPEVVSGYGLGQRCLTGFRRLLAVDATSRLAVCHRGRQPQKHLPGMDRRFIGVPPTGHPPPTFTPMDHPTGTALAVPHVPLTAIADRSPSNALHVGDPIRILYGPLRGLVGSLQEIQGGECLAQLPSVGSGVYVRVPVAMIDVPPQDL